MSTHNANDSHNSHEKVNKLVPFNMSEQVKQKRKDLATGNFDYLSPAQKQAFLSYTGFTTPRSSKGNK